MSEPTTGIVVLAGLVLVNSLLSHRFISRLWLASIVASAASAILFQVFVTVRLGYLDKFFIIALQFSLLYGFFGSLAIGYLMRRLGIAAGRRDAT
jgi:hypothetical protein